MRFNSLPQEKRQNIIQQITDLLRVNNQEEAQQILNEYGINLHTFATNHLIEFYNEIQNNPRNNNLNINYHLGDNSNNSNNNNNNNKNKRSRSRNRSRSRGSKKRSRSRSRGSRTIKTKRLSSGNKIIKKKS